jgi:hypothetical protein
VHLFRALERSPHAIVATVLAPRPLDDESFVATLRVEVVLAGDLSRGARLELAWEELSRARPPRFADGDRVLLALEPLPGASLWRARLPDPTRRLATWTVAERGDAFLRDPGVGEVELVLHFLALPPDLRDGNPGAAHLVRLAEAAQVPLAAAALERLGEIGGLDPLLGETSAARLARVLSRGDPRLVEPTLALIERHHLESLRPTLLAEAAADGSGPAPVYEALARLDGGLAKPLTEALLDRADAPAHRRVGARYAAKAATARLARLLRLDPAPEVRAAAVTRLVELHGVSEIDRVLFALDDADPTVRARAMVVVSELGAAAVPPLTKVVEAGSPEAARTAVGALQATGPQGTRALERIADEHPDEGVRTLARIALGRPIGHRHE